jgi:hypothetical protein
MKQWKMRLDDLCPHCDNPEDAAHVWTCHGEGVDKILEKALQDLERWLNSKQMDPDLQYTIIAHLRGWQDNQPNDSSQFFVFDELLRCQSTIGWNHFFEGWMSTDWLVLQQAYYNYIKSHQSGK